MTAQTRDATCLWLTLRNDNILYTKFPQFQRRRNSCRASTDDQNVSLFHFAWMERTLRLMRFNFGVRDSLITFVPENDIHGSLTIKPLATSLHGARPPSQGIQRLRRDG